MKNIKILTILFLTMIGFTSCLDDDSNLTYVAQPTGEFEFSNSFLPEYVLTSTTASNLGERFTWQNADFGVETNVSYELEKSILGDFSDAEVIGSTSANEYAISIGKLLNYATEAGLDNDPNTEEPNTGVISFRVRAFVGDSSSTEIYTPVVELTVVLPEDTGSGSGISATTWGVVGSGYNNWSNDGDYPAPLQAPIDAVFYTTSDPDVVVAYVNLLDGHIKIREDNAWALNYGDTGVDGILDEGGDDIEVTAGDYKITFNTSTLAYSIDPFSWGVVGSGFNNWSDGGTRPDAKLYYDYTTDTFKASVKLFEGHIKFRMDNDWAVNLGDTGADGTLESGGDDIPVIEGHYLITLNLNDNSYTLEEAPVWGVVGSGYNNWGADEWDHDGDAGTPNVKVSDAALTEIQPGVWFVENITLLDGHVKFRVDNDWGESFGDLNLDNILDTDDGNDIPVVAGNYVITIDFNDADGPKYRLGKRN